MTGKLKLSGKIKLLVKRSGIKLVHCKCLHIVCEITQSNTCGRLDLKMEHYKLVKSVSTELCVPVTSCLGYIVNKMARLFQGLPRTVRTSEENLG